VLDHHDGCLHTLEAGKGLMVDQVRLHGASKRAAEARLELKGFPMLIGWIREGASGSV